MEELGASVYSEEDQLHGVSSEGLIRNEVTTVETSTALQNPAALNGVRDLHCHATCSD